MKYVVLILLSVASTSSYGKAPLDAEAISLFNEVVQEISRTFCETGKIPKKADAKKIFNKKQMKVFRAIKIKRYNNHGLEAHGDLEVYATIQPDRAVPQINHTAVIKC